MVHPIRPHCRKPFGCDAAKPTTHCRACCVLANAKKSKAKRLANLRARIKAPGYQDEALPRRMVGFAAWLENGGREVRAENARRQHQRKREEIPLAYREEYARLKRQYRMTPAEARALIDEQIRKDTARYLATGKMEHVK